MELNFGVLKAYSQLGRLDAFKNLKSMEDSSIAMLLEQILLQKSIAILIIIKGNEL